jgi:hypothetical protein
MLLIGPTGVGKTPFGSCLEKNGFRGRRCLHFDFGHELRTVAQQEVPPKGSVAGRDVFRLKVASFSTAEDLYSDFLSRWRPSGI